MEHPTVRIFKIIFKFILGRSNQGVDRVLYKVWEATALALEPKKDEGK